MYFTSTCNLLCLELKVQSQLTLNAGVVLRAIANKTDSPGKCKL